MKIGEEVYCFKSESDTRFPDIEGFVSGRFYMIADIDDENNQVFVSLNHPEFDAIRDLGMWCHFDEDKRYDIDGNYFPNYFYTKQPHILRILG